jgi:hypothetical protein
VAAALVKMAPTSKTHFSIVEARGKIMFGVFELLNKNDEDVQDKAFEALVDIARINHKSMEEYFESICMVTKTFVEKAVTENEPTRKGALLSIEVWNFIFEAELQAKINKGT